MPSVSLTSETRPKRSFFSSLRFSAHRARLALFPSPAPVLFGPLGLLFSFSNSKKIYRKSIWKPFQSRQKLQRRCNFSFGCEQEKKQASMLSVSLVSETRPKRSFFSAPENKFANFVEKCRFLIIFNANSAKYFTYNDLDFVFS